jgi:hypothetical protein
VTPSGGVTQAALATLTRAIEQGGA